ncbi:ABC transporter permease [Brevundimonas aurifodinae]|uniref:ABC transporter permease n=2 Tax=Brevundimonas TaxID=41275 RepID=A0ABV1NMG9_9CAUL|nr:MAG: ABC transporter permease [Brevundimonas sp. 12-68-7]OYX36086.1 MAG: ABC transporter permease [Brevundimonas subvibrioides]
MRSVALKMLLGDSAKYLALVFGVAFATLLMSQQVSIFIGLMTRTANQVLDIREADIWVMDTRVRYVDEVEPMPDAALGRVRSVEGVEWAAPLYKGLAIFRTQDGLINQVSLVGIDDETLVGAPREWLAGDLEALRRPGGIVFDKEGASLIWPDADPLTKVGTEAEINDRRVVVTGIADASPPFITFPIAYVRYSEAMALTPPQRNKLSFVLVRAKDGQDAKALAERISAQTGLQALTWDSFAWRSVQYYLTRTGIPVNFGITVMLGFVVGAAVTAQTFYLFVIENLRQFGALKAIGATNGQITGMVLLQAAVVGLMGYGLGMGGAALFFTLVRGGAALEDFYLPWQVLVGTGVVVFLIILISVLGSLTKVFRVDPAIVFRG